LNNAAPASPSGIVASVASEWTAPHAEALDRWIGAFLAEADRHTGAAADTSIDMHDVRAFDTFGAWQLSRLARELKSRGRELKIVGLKEHHAGLLEAVEKSSTEAAETKAATPVTYWGLAAVGKAVADASEGIPLLLNMLGAVCASAFRAIVKPSTFRLTSTVHHLDRVGWQAVPIILLITFLIGAIIAQQGFFHFRKFGADDYVVDMVGILVLREIGVLIVAIMVAGRSGSSYTAELGSMKMREEIDALRTMGFDPVDVLVLPRVVALVIALPILTFLGSMSALYGGELVAWLYGGMSPDIFVARLKEAISITHFKVGMIKAPFMALVIGIVACTAGLKVKGSAESLGLQTTSSVVTSIFLVIVLDGLFAIFFASIGM
jgi:phospholipid/cholesterol/gamma-HCH transport system permease protein